MRLGILRDLPLVGIVFVVLGLIFMIIGGVHYAFPGGWRQVFALIFPQSTHTPEPLILTRTPSAPTSPLPSPVRSVEPTTVVETAAVPIAASPTLMSSVPLSQSAMLTPTRPAVKGEVRGFDILNCVILVIIVVGGIVLGFGFIAGGMWLWHQ